MEATAREVGDVGLVLGMNEREIEDGYCEFGRKSKILFLLL